MNYNSFLSKDYKFLNSTSRKKNHNYKMILLGIVTVSTSLYGFSLYFSNQESVALADSEPNISNTSSQQLPTQTQQNLIIEPLSLDAPVSNRQLSTIVLEAQTDPNQLLAKQIENRVNPAINQNIVQKTNDSTHTVQSHDSQLSDISLTTKVVRVRKKDSMAAIFRRNGLSGRTLHQLANKTRLGKELTRLKPGQKVTFILDDKKQIHSLKLQKNSSVSIAWQRKFEADQYTYVSSIEKIVVSSNKKQNSQNQSKQSKTIATNTRTGKTQSKRTVTKSKPPQKIAEQKKLPPLKDIASIKTVIVKKGDTLAAIFKRNGLGKTTLHHIVHSGKQGKQLTRIRPGQKIIFIFDKNEQLLSLHLQKNRIETLILQRDFSSSSKKPQYLAAIDKKEVEIRTQFSSGTINGSFFNAAKKSGLSNSMTMKLAHLFGWDIDFALNIRAGDSFSVLYEEKYLEGEKIANGDIVAAEFINQGEVFQAVRYTDAGGRTDYYTPEGYSMRKAFLRTPVAFSRISSRFSLGRRHPVLNRIRAHKGVDYAAPRGTPIKATGSGKVIYKGRKGGYGKVVQIRHANKYETLYAHLSSYNRKIKKGSRVKQGQVIGYVGSTGLATGPHLHYEFRINGVHRNPLTVKLPNADPINKKYKGNFVKASSTLLSKLTLEKKQQLASAE